MQRKIVSIDASKCSGCGLCVNACHEGAIELVDGKAVLVSDEYCDGLGDCLPACPEGAITIIEREAADYDEAAVEGRQRERAASSGCAGGCPGSAARVLGGHHHGGQGGCPGSAARKLVGHHHGGQGCCSGGAELQSELRTWPIQLALVNPRASYLDGADLLVAADCTAFAYAGIHPEFMRDRVTLIACPKLDHYNHQEKLAAIFGGNDIRSLTVLRMEVPCCGGLVHIVRQAIEASGKELTPRVVTIGTDGRVLSED